MTSARTRSEYRLLLDGASVAPAGGAPFTLRRVEPGDRDVLSMVLLDAYRGSVDDEGEGPEEASEAIDDYFSMMAWPHGRVLELEDTIGAFAFVVVVGHRHYIDPVATARAAQRRGLGTAVVRAVLASLRAGGSPRREQRSPTGTFRRSGSSHPSGLRVSARGPRRSGPDRAVSPRRHAGHTPMMIAMTTSVTSSCAMLSRVSPLGRLSKASWVMNRAAVKPAQSTIAVTIVAHRKPPP